MAFDLMDWLFGHSPEMKSASTFRPEQEQFQQMLLGKMGGPTNSGMDFLQQILSGDESAFQDFEAPIKRQFEQEVVPGIAERFAGMGSGGAMSSSGFNQTMARSGRELSQNLAQLRSGLKMGALQQLQGMMGQGMQRGKENMYDPGSMGFVGQYLANSGEGSGKAGANYFLGA